MNSFHPQLVSPYFCPLSIPASLPPSLSHSYLQTHVLLQLDRDVGVVFPVLWKVIKLVGVGEDQDDHLVHNYRQPEPIQEITPR